VGDYFIFIFFLANLISAKDKEDAEDKSVGTGSRILQFALKTMNGTETIRTTVGRATTI